MFTGLQASTEPNEPSTKKIGTYVYSTMCSYYEDWMTVYARYLGGETSTGTEKMESSYG